MTGSSHPFIRLKTSVKGAQVENVLKKTEFKLLAWLVERIRQAFFTLGVICRKCEELELEIRSHFRWSYSRSSS